MKYEIHTLNEYIDCIHVRGLTGSACNIMNVSAEYVMAEDVIVLPGRGMEGILDV